MRKQTQINKLLGIEDSYQAPEKLMSILYDREAREKLFMEFLELYDYRVDIDYFHEYFQEEHADRKQKKQDFTPNSVGKLLSQLVGSAQGTTRYEPCAGTGGITIQTWDHDRKQHSPFVYRPSWYLYHCEELSSRALPFLLFNCLLRGMNAVVVHCDVLTRKSYGAFFIQNDLDDHLQFSSLNVLPYSNDVAEFLAVEWVEEKYKPLKETKEIPAHIADAMLLLRGGNP